MAERAPFFPRLPRSAAGCERGSEHRAPPPRAALPLIAPRPADCPATRTHAAAASGWARRRAQGRLGFVVLQRPTPSLGPARPPALRTTGPGVRGRCGAAAARAGFWGPPDRRAARRAGRGLRGLAAPGVPWGGGRERRGLLADSSRLGPAGSPLLSSREGAPVRRRVLEGRVVRCGAVRAAPGGRAVRRPRGRLGWAWPLVRPRLRLMRLHGSGT